MIRYDTKTWFRHIVHFHRSDTLRQLIPEILIIGAYTVGITYLAKNHWEDYGNLSNTTTVHSLIGFVIGLLMVFRTNTAYDRWWEGRKHWGALVNESRNLAIRLNAYLTDDDEENRTFFKVMIPNYVWAMKEHLREGVKLEEIDDIDGLVEELEKKDHKPNDIASRLYKRVKQLNNQGRISNEEQMLLDKEVKSFTDIIGACERIRNTPIPYAYSLFIKKVIFFYAITLPFGFIPDFGYWTVAVVIFIFYVLVSLELLAEEIEDPFGRDANDLPTDELAAKITANVKEIL